MSEKKPLEQQLEELREELRLRLDLVNTDITRELGKMQAQQAEEDFKALKRDYDALKLSSAWTNRSMALFYLGILLGVLSGVIGNIFVSLLFQPSTVQNLVQLGASGVGFVIACAFFMIEFWRWKTHPS